MKEQKIPISLSQLLITNTGPDFRPSPQRFKKLPFDERQDIAVSERDPHIAIRMDVLNDGVLQSITPKGVKRELRVILLDSISQKAVHTATLKVVLKKGEATTSVYSLVPIEYESLNFDHSHKVIVVDEKTGKRMGEREIRVFKLFYGELFCGNLVNPVYGGVQPYYSTDLYKGFWSEDMAYHYVKFYLRRAETDRGPAVLPEVEVRIYFPDGSTARKFVRPERVNNGEELYEVVASFLHTSLKRGICYAELICLDFLTCGFIFSTVEEEPIKGSWSGRGLDYLDLYTPDKAARRYRKNLLMEQEESCEGNPAQRASELEEENLTDKGNDPEGSDAAEEEDYFEGLLKEFISSAKGDDGETSEGGVEEEKIDKEGVVETNETGEDNETPGANDMTETNVVCNPSPLRALDNLTGLSEVKEKIRKYEKYVLFNKKREEAGLAVINQPLHAMFCGSPGTGKTTVAKRMGMMLRRAGVLSRGHVVVRERSTLLGIHYSSEQTNTLAALDEAQGGILFIDEAYQLYQPDDPRDPGRLVIDALLSALADNSRRDWMLILAGYTDEMRRMFEMNPGFKSRIPESNIYLFPDYSEEELTEIAVRYLERHGYTLTPAAQERLAHRLSTDSAQRDKTFGNARHVINLIQTEILPAMASRVMESESFDPESLSVVEACDIPESHQKLASKQRKVGFRA